LINNMKKYFFIFRLAIPNKSVFKNRL